MKYRIKEVVEGNTSFYYPQWKKRWFWRRFVWYGGEDGTFPYTCFYQDKGTALDRIDQDRAKRAIKPEPRKIIYHIV